ncbi:MAG: CDP-diacylglycerol--serine O-phosphatidyltransferase, partial [Desulfobacterales bacterium]|nr:CDP-diacylglycerol--serine O-phosphatidyltransferase [Desulfobacterales bacterium]
SATVLLFHRFGWVGSTRHVTILVMIYVLSFLMVSTIKYYGFKDAEPFKKMKFNMLVIVILSFIVVAAEPCLSLFLIMLGYIASGPFTTLRLHKKNQQDKTAADNGVDTHSQKLV